MILVQITNKHGTIQRRYDEGISDIEFLLACADIKGEAETGVEILRRRVPHQGNIERRPGKLPKPGRLPRLPAGAAPPQAARHQRGPPGIQAARPLAGILGPCRTGDPHMTRKPIRNVIVHLDSLPFLQGDPRAEQTISISGPINLAPLSDDEYVIVCCILDVLASIGIHYMKHISFECQSEYSYHAGKAVDVMHPEHLSYWASGPWPGDKP